MNHLLTIVFLLFTVLSSIGQQNLILNGDFEEYWECPDDATQIERCKYVFNPCSSAPSTSDYFNACYSGGFGAPVGVPNASNGYQNSQSGNGMVGFFCSDDPNFHYREYIQLSLSEPLKCGAKYFLEGYLNLGNIYRYTIRNFGVLFSEQQINENDFLYKKYTPQIIDSNTLINDTLNWIKVSYEFVADEPYSFLTIGHFQNDSIDSYHEVYPQGIAQQFSAYFYVDNFSLIELVDVDVDVEFPNVITPNGDGINDEFKPLLQKDIHIDELIILNRWGNTIITLHSPISWDGTDKSGNQVTQGVYFYVAKSKKNCKIKKEQVGMIHVIH